MNNIKFINKVMNADHSATYVLEKSVLFAGSMITIIAETFEPQYFQDGNNSLIWNAGVKLSNDILEFMTISNDTFNLKEIDEYPKEISINGINHLVQLYNTISDDISNLNNMLKACEKTPFDLSYIYDDASDEMFWESELTELVARMMLWKCAVLTA